MKNTMEHLNIFSLLLQPILTTIITTLIPIFISWIHNKLKATRNIYASHINLYYNASIYGKAMSKAFINIMLLIVVTIVSIIISFFQNAYPYKIITWIGIYTFTYVFQILIMGKGYYGIDRNGNRKNYTPSIYLFTALINLDLLFIIILTINNLRNYVKICYVLEIVLITAITLYIVNIKKVKYCESVILVTNHNETRTIAIENFLSDENGSVIIRNQNKNIEQINSSFIEKKEAIYSNEYIQWIDKIHSLNTEEKTVKKNNNDIRWGWVVLIAIIPVIISIIDFCTYESCKISSRLIMNDNLLSDLFSQQITISSMFIAAASLIVNNINDRFVGASTKYILFKKYIFYFNYITIILMLLALDVSSFIAYLLQSKWGLIISFVASAIWLFELLKLTYYLLSKKSKIYFVILKKLDNELVKKKSFVVYNSLLNKLDSFTDKNIINDSDLIHDSYFVEEMLILYKMKSIACDPHKEDYKIIDNAKKYYIRREERTGEKLKKLFDQYHGSDCPNIIEWIKEDLDTKDNIK